MVYIRLGFSIPTFRLAFGGWMNICLHHLHTLKITVMVATSIICGAQHLEPCFEAISA